MDGPGEYLPDVTEGITRVEDLPKPRLPGALAITDAGRARNASIRPTATGWSRGPCTTWVI